MRKSLRIVIPTLLFMIMCLTILTPAAMAAENPSVDISVTVTLSGTLPETPEDFLIKLSAEEMSNPMPEGSLNGISTVIATGAGTVTFPTITYDRVGMYEYTVWQQVGTNPDAVYDTSVYHLKVYVTNAPGGGLEVTTVLYKNDDTEKSPDIIFENTYANPALVNFRALKSLDGKVPADGLFTFRLTDESGTLLQTKTNAGQDVIFDGILLKEAGTHIFYIREVKGTNPKILYDPAVYKVTVTVMKNSEGNYEAAVFYERDGSPFTGIPVFANQTIPGDLPNTGESQSALPFIGVILVLGGAALTLRRKTVK